jgi:hypothetical protein
MSAPSERTAGPARSALQKTGATSSLSRSRVICRAKKRISTALGHGASTGSEVCSLVVAREQRRRAAALAGGLGDALDVRPRPVWARRRSRRNTDNGNYQRTYRTRARLDVLADAAPLEGRRRAAQSAFPAAGRCRRSVPGALPRREDAVHRVPVPVPAVAPIRISPQYRCLNVVTVARPV